MKQGTLLRDNRLLAAVAFMLIAAGVYAAHLQGGVSMELGDVLLSIKSHQEGGLVVSFIKAH
jgi:hypothetical protein